MANRSKPIRWRRASFPEAGSRWDTPMNRAVWQRDHGEDMEAWRDGKHLATVTPRGSGWAWRLEDGAARGEADDLGTAKLDAAAAVKSDYIPCPTCNGAAGWGRVAPGSSLLCGCPGRIGADGKSAWVVQLIRRPTPSIAPESGEVEP